MTTRSGIQQALEQEVIAFIISQVTNFTIKLSCAGCNLQSFHGPKENTKAKFYVNLENSATKIFNMFGYLTQMMSGPNVSNCTVTSKARELSWMAINDFEGISRR